MDDWTGTTWWTNAWGNGSGWANDMPSVKSQEETHKKIKKDIRPTIKSMLEHTVWKNVRLGHWRWLLDAKKKKKNRKEGSKKWPNRVWSDQIQIDRNRMMTARHTNGKTYQYMLDCGRWGLECRMSRLHAKNKRTNGRLNEMRRIWITKWNTKKRWHFNYLCWLLWSSPPYLCCCCRDDWLPVLLELHFILNGSARNRLPPLRQILRMIAGLNATRIA